MAAVRKADSYDDGLLDAISTRLQYAFHPADRGRDSSLAQFDGRRRSKQHGGIELKPTSTLWTRRHQATETRAAQFSKPLIQEQDWDSIAVVRAVNELPELSLCLVRYKYMPPSNEQFGYGIRLGRMFWATYQRHFNPRTKAEVRNTVKRIADAVILSEHNFTIRLLLEKSKPWELFGISRDTWYETYRWHWMQLREEMYLIYGEALMSVYGRL